MATELGVKGLGSDLVDVARFRQAVERRTGLSERLFSDAERAYADGLGDPVKSLADLDEITRKIRHAMHQKHLRQAEEELRRMKQEAFRIFLG